MIGSENDPHREFLKQPIETPRKTDQGAVSQIDVQMNLLFYEEHHKLVKEGVDPTRERVWEAVARRLLSESSEEQDKKGEPEC